MKLLPSELFLGKITILDEFGVNFHGKRKNKDCKPNIVYIDLMTAERIRLRIPELVY